MTLLQVYIKVLAGINSSSINSGSTKAFDKVSSCSTRNGFGDTPVAIVI